MSQQSESSSTSAARPRRAALIAGIVALLPWGALVVAWLARALYSRQYLDGIGLPDYYFESKYLYGAVFGIGGLVGLWTWQRAVYRPTLWNLFVASVGFLPLWQAAVYFADELGFYETRAALGKLGPATAFVIGLAWLVWFVERRWNAHLRESAEHPDHEQHAGLIWNPFHPRAWYYGRSGAKLNQSLAVLTTYTLLFVSLFILAGQMQGCQEVYDLPAGGGQDQQVAQTVQIQKVIKKKFVINPYSSIIFNPPPIEDIQLKLQELTQNQYRVGQGSGDGAGFDQGTGQGKIRFIRLEYSGGDWNQDFGIGADLNMLIEYGVLTGQNVESNTESFQISRLENFPPDRCPPLMYLTGQGKILLSKNEIKTLRQYLLDKHGMLFIDNGGSSDFHRQAFEMMRQIVPEVEPVKVPLDDTIHQRPFPIPFLPFVAPHGGREAYGWKVDGRWIAYYHPGDIGDAWSDGHSGVNQDVWTACYRLGANVIYYAHAEYNAWLRAKRGSR